MRTWQEIAKETLEIQSAVDLVPVVRRFLQVIIDLEEKLKNKDDFPLFANLQEAPTIMAFVS